MNPNTRSKVISIRLSAAEYSQLAADAEQQKTAVSGVLLAAWRNQNALDAQHDRLAEISAAIKRLEEATPDLQAIASWAQGVNDRLVEINDAQAKRQQRMEKIIFALAKALGCEVRLPDA